MIKKADDGYIVMTGPPGAGKTMLARRLPSILPPLNPRELNPEVPMEVVKLLSKALEDGDDVLAEVLGTAHVHVGFAAAQRDHGSVAPKAQGRTPGTAGKLAAHMDFLLERVKSEPDITLQELADALREARGVEVQLSSIHRALIRAGDSYKKRAGSAGT